MKQLEFQRKYLGQFLMPDLAYQKAVKLWMLYYYKVEEYDRSVCTGFSHYGFEPCAIPQTPNERSLSNSNARKEYEDMMRTMIGLEIDEKDFKRAKQEAGNYRHDQIKEMLRIK